MKTDQLTANNTRHSSSMVTVSLRGDAVTVSAARGGVSRLCGGRRVPTQ